MFFKSNTAVLASLGFLLIILEGCLLGISWIGLDIHNFNIYLLILVAGNPDCDAEISLCNFDCEKKCETYGVSCLDLNLRCFLQCMYGEEFLHNGSRVSSTDADCR